MFCILFGKTVVWIEIWIEEHPHPSTKRTRAVRPWFQISFRSAFSETSVYERPCLLEIDFRVVVAAFEELFHFLDAWLAWVGASAGVCNCVHCNVVKA